jgi:hypothetical protein
VVNSLGGVLTCGVGQGGNGIALAVTVGAQMTSVGTKRTAVDNASDSVAPVECAECDELIENDDCACDDAEVAAGCATTRASGWLSGLLRLALVALRRRRRREPSLSSQKT